MEELRQGYPSKHFAPKYHRKSGDCPKCHCPTLGKVTKKSHCICNDPIAMERCRDAVKDHCASCGRRIDTKEKYNPEMALDRYFSRGNYCAMCSNKKLEGTRGRPKNKGLDYDDYIEQAMNRGEQFLYRKMGTKGYNQLQ